jgi:hypothetical protein
LGTPLTPPSSEYLASLRAGSITTDTRDFTTCDDTPIPEPGAWEKCGERSVMRRHVRSVFSAAYVGPDGWETHDENGVILASGLETSDAGKLAADRAIDEYRAGLAGLDGVRLMIGTREATQREVERIADALRFHAHHIEHRARAAAHDRECCAIIHAHDLQWHAAHTLYTGVVVRGYTRCSAPQGFLAVWQPTCAADFGLRDSHWYAYNYGVTRLCDTLLEALQFACVTP